MSPSESRVWLPGRRWAARRCLAAIVPMILAAWLPAAEPQPPAEPSAGVGQLRQNDPGFLVRADVDRGSRTYRQGDPLSIQVASEADAYLYVLYKQADEKVFLIYPNSAQPDSRVKARQAVQIPAGDDLFRWKVGPPFGKEVIKVIACKEKLADLEDPAMRAKWFNPVRPQQVKGIELELGKPQPPPWAEDFVEILTYPRDEKLDLPAARRWGVFIGVGQYEFNDEALAASDGKAELNLPPCHRDANRLAGLMGEVGQLHGVKVCTNDQATKQHIEAAIAGWLPSVTRPGDTVFIFFSGGVLPAAATDAGKAGAVLAPYDFMPLDVVPVLLKQYKEKGVAKSVAERLKALAPLLEQAATPQQKATVLARATGIGDDLLAHWLQRLSGRQIVLLLDTPLAAAFAPPQTGAAPAGDRPAPQLLADPVERLKGLGQREIALLGACGANPGGVLRVEDQLSLQTHCLVRALAALPGPITLEQAHEHTAKTLAEVFAAANEKRRAEGKEPLPPYQPYLVNTCSRPVVLKP